MGQAAHAIGNTELEEKFTASLEMLDRPNTVVFNPSYAILLSLRLRQADRWVDCIYKIKPRLAGSCIACTSRMHPTNKWRKNF